MNTHDIFVAECLQDKPVEQFRIIVEEYFRLALSRRPPTPTRRPLVAFRFDWDFRFVVRPHWSRRQCQVDPTILEVEAFTGHQCWSAYKVLELRMSPEAKWKEWSAKNGDQAMLAFADLIEHFVRWPQDVFRRSSTHCCCCGKRFTDHSSMARGIGPDCIKWFQPWLDQRKPAEELAAVERDRYLTETGFSK